MADYLNYVLGNPDLRENAEALGLTQAEMREWGKTHWDNHGSKGEGRLNTPHNVGLESAFTEVLGKEHYSAPVWGDRSAEDILQSSVRRADNSRMWDAREDLDENWNLDQFSSTDWNMAQDNPYYTGILGNTIDVDTGVGQIYDTGDNLFVQDRYNTGSQANDFLDDWVTDNKWTGPDWGENYWDVLTTAERDADGNLRATIPRESTGWDTSGSNNTIVENGSIVSKINNGNIRTASGGGAGGAMDLLAYRPWTQNYWTEYVPKASQGLLYMNKPQRDYGISYLPGEFRDPSGWENWRGGDLGHRGHIPEGAWVRNPASWPSYTHQGRAGDNPWLYTTTPSATNIYNNPWTARSMNLTRAQGRDWEGFLSDIDTSPTMKPGLLTTGKGGPINFPTAG